MRQKDLIEISITGVLLVVLIFAFGNTAKKTRSRILKNNNAKAVSLAVVAPVQEDQMDSKNMYTLLEQEAKTIELRRDPFTAAPIINEKNMQSGFALTGILWDKVKPLAIIDGEVVKKGGRVGNKVVVDIKRDRVILSDGQDLFEVILDR